MNNGNKIADPDSREENSVKKMFSRVAPFYDAANRAMTFGLDVLWRRRLVRALFPRGAAGAKTGADIACGSGDVALEIAAKYPDAEIKCADFCKPMLEIAAKKFAKKRPYAKVEFVEADCENLPFGDAVFDGATISFGFRNFRNRPACLREIFRTLKPDARLCVLEVCRARGAFAAAQKIFMGKFVPLAASLCGGVRADYEYLAETTLAYPPREEIEKMFLDAGFESVSTRPMAFGLVAITAGQKGKK